MGLLRGAPRRAAGTAAIASIMLSGCQIGFPDASDTGENSKRRLPDVSTVAGARAYVKAGRDAMVAQQDWVRAADLTSDLGVLGGGIIALMGGLLHWDSRSVIKGGVLAGGSLAANYALSPKAQLAVLDKGLEALSCVDTQAEAGFAVVGKLDDRLDSIRIAVSALRAEIDDANAHDPKPNDALKTAIMRNRAYAYQMDLYVKDQARPVENAGQKVRLATDVVIRATNEQLHTLLPDGDAIRQTLGQATAAIPGASPSAGNAPSRPAAATPSAAPANALSAKEFLGSILGSVGSLENEEAQSRASILNAEMNAKAKEIEAKAAAVADAVAAFQQREKEDPTPPTAMNFDSCRPAAAAGLKADVTSIAATVNKTFTFHVSGGPSNVSWSGSAPPGTVTLDPAYSFSNPATYTVKTDTATGSGSYAIVVSGAGSSIRLPFTAN